MRDSIIFSQQKKENTERRMMGWLSEWLVTLCLTVGFWGLVFGTMEYQWIGLPDVMGALVLLILFGYIFYYGTPKKKVRISLAYVIGILLAFMVFQNDFVEQSRYFLNCISELVGKTYGQIVPLYDLSVAKIDRMYFIFTGTLLLVAGILFSFVVHYENTVLCGLLILFSIVFQGIFQGNKFFFVLFVLGNLFVMAQKTKEKFNKNSLTSIVLTVCVMTIIGLAAAQIPWEVPESIRSLHYQCVQTWKQIRYGQQGKIALEVTMETPQSYYLRGFVGSELGAYGWQPTDNEVQYESADLFYWLHRENFYGQSQLPMAAQIFGKTEEAVNKIQIKNVGASKEYLYTPYEYLSAAENFPANTRKIGDENIPTKEVAGSSAYWFYALSNQVSKYPDIVSHMEDNRTEETEAYYLLESQYRAYIYDTYTNLDEEQKDILQAHFGEEQPDKLLSYGTVKGRIIQYLSEHITYNELCETSVDNQKFLQQFLEISCEGDACAYATAAVLMFRYYGIPARYVEGYLITPEDVEGAESENIIAVPVSNAHSWAEYYYDGIGWIPFEAVTYYKDLMGIPEETGESIGGSSSKQEEKVEDVSDDNYEEDISEEEEKVEIPIFFGEILFLVIVFVLWGIWAIRYLLAKRRYLRQLRIDDNALAVRFLFSHMMQMMFAFQFTERNQFLGAYETEMGRIEAQTAHQAIIEGKKAEKNRTSTIESSCSLTYSTAVKLYQRARYGSGGCTKEEREAMLRYTNQMEHSVYRSLRVVQKCKWKRKSVGL